MVQRLRIKCVNAGFVAALCFFCTYAHAQTTGTKKLQFDAITIKDGLSQGMVTWIMQDHYGFLWIATKDGLNRYDGSHFVVYRHDPSDSSSIADNYIETVFEDSKGRLWVGTTSQGLDLFDRETEKFQHFKNIANDMRFEHVGSITEDQQRRIWVALDTGVVVITEHERKVQSPVFTFKKFTDKLARVFVANDGTIWISERHGPLYTIRSEDGEEHLDSVPVEKYAWFPEDEDGYERLVWAFCEDTVNHKLYLFMRYGVSIMDETTNTFSFRRTGNKNSFHLTAHGNGNRIWLINDFGLQQFDTRTGEFTSIETADERLKDLTKKTTILYGDRTGIIWIGTTGYGILKHNPRAEKFHRTDEQSIHWMQQRNDGTLMLVKEGARIYLFDKDQDKYTGSVPDVSTEKNAAYLDGITEAAVQANDGSYWICKQTLIKYDPAGGHFTRYLDMPSFPVFKDGDGEIWFGSDNSFCRYDKATGKFIYYAYPVQVPNYPYKSLQAIYEDENGFFWLGTTLGLFRFDPVNKQWKQFKNDPSDSTSLSFNAIFCIYPDPLQPGKYLWLGTNGGGLNCFDKQSGKVIRYSSKNGLANDVVYGILSDNDGNLWMSTNNGLSRLDKSRKKFHNYNVNDGLQGNEYNRNAFCKTKDGILFFGGVNGFNYFDPAELNDSTVVPNVMITGFRISNQAVSFQSEHSPLSKPVYLTDKITLPYRENMISFDFVSFDLTNPEKNLYKYKLEGFDKDWIPSGTEHSATYTNLDPGTYTFRITASNSDGVWNETGKSLLLVILPPWYMTWWFRIGVMIIIISAVYAFYKYRLSRALELQAVRNRIASDLHDEIGSNLSNIFIFSNVAQQRAEFPEETSTLMRKISDYTQGSMEAMSDIVWMINARNDRFENIIVRMRSLAAEIFEATNTNLHMQFDERLNNLNLNMEERKNFYLIYKEAINNIAKYAECKDVWISMNLDHNNVLLEIKDNGKGFDLQDANTGNGLFNMRKRANMLKGKFLLTSKPGNGTSIQLSFEV